MSEFRWIKTEDALSECVELWLSEDFIALDTEFERTSTFFANAGLVQVADSRMVYLIDPLEVPSLAPLAKVLADPKVTKVLHSMSEDIELLRKETGVTPLNVFDTQVAAGFLGYGLSLGYQNLVSLVLEVELDKSETRSDWLQRPLSAEQISYAVKDTSYLRDLYLALQEQLLLKGLLDACLDECTFLVQQSNDIWDKADTAYLRVRGGWDLPLEQQRLLQQLVFWRDTTAMRENLPKSWVFPDDALVHVVRHPPENARALYRIKGLKPKVVKQFGERLVDELADIHREQGVVSSVSHDENFEPIEGPLRGAELKLFRKLKSTVKRVAEANALEPQLMATRKHLENAVIGMMRRNDESLPHYFCGWRARYLGDALQNTYRDFMSVDEH